MKNWREEREEGIKEGRKGVGEGGREKYPILSLPSPPPPPFIAFKSRGETKE